MWSIPQKLQRANMAQGKVDGVCWVGTGVVIIDCGTEGNFV